MMGEILVVLTWGIMCAVVALEAAGRGRSTMGYFVFSLFVSPLIGLLLLYVLDLKKADT